MQDMREITFETKDEAIAAGCIRPIHYRCEECGYDYWSEWRSKIYRLEEE